MVVVAGTVKIALTVLTTVDVEVGPGASQEQKPLITLVATLSTWHNLFTFGSVVDLLWIVSSSGGAERAASGVVVVVVVVVVVNSLVTKANSVAVVVVVVEVVSAEARLVQVDAGQ